MQLEFGAARGAVVAFALAAAARRGDGEAHVVAAALGADLVAPGEPSAAAAMVVLGALAIGAVVAGRPGW
ncbi:MAG TPA: hypothetical protein VN253_15150 [Kofleriaceae bacterium]|nr:hypothetical protein [Kofleriaceae bacterium]